ncbi:MAG TPA: DNA-processing protein DprA [Nitrospirota bacterium]|nr:DNA-processing protein DprA [Nitrospirota bacterium]
MPTLSAPALSWIGLNSIPGVGRTTFRKLVSLFGSPEQALSASENELRERGGLSEALITELRAYPWREHAEKELAKARNAEVTIVTIEDAAYPGHLRNSPDPPLYLYVKGALLPEDANAVAIVGTRKPTHYGLTMTHRIAYELASAGLTIVSGMARGIDTQAHRGALAAKGRTIAVLGCGIDVAYPPENKGLMEQISHAGRGAVVAENPFNTKPEAGYFPARNRIISGLSRGTVIIEAAEDSGSLITAEYTVKQGRLLFALPGNIGSPNSRGPNSLIKEGALLVERAEDILKALKFTAAREKKTDPEPAPRIPLSREEETVFRCITNEPKHIDLIMTEAGATPGKISGTLITLELKGLARQLPGKLFVREE